MSSPSEHEKLPWEEQGATGPPLPYGEEGTDEEPVKMKFFRSASIAISPDATSNLSFILDMDREEATEYTQTLHDELDKIFEESPKFSVEALTSGTEGVVSERSTIEEETHHAPERNFDEYDFKSHRRASFPHAHVPLRSLSKPKLKSSSEKKKKKDESKQKKAGLKTKKQKFFPSVAAIASVPAIPEVEEQHASEEGSASAGEEEAEQDEERRLLETKDKLENEGAIRTSFSFPAAIGSEEAVDGPDPTHVSVPLLSITDTTGVTVADPPLPKVMPVPPVKETVKDRTAAFYIGDTERDGSPARDARSFVSSMASSRASADDLELDTEENMEEETPLVSPAMSRRTSYDQGGKVTFQLGGDQVSDHGASSDVWVPQSRDESSNSLASDVPKSSKQTKHRRHHHHDRFQPEDLFLRRQKGSEKQLSDTLKRVPTETDEAMMLHSADLDEMASHRRADAPGLRRHKIGRNKKKTISSVVHIGRNSKTGSSRKYFKPQKKKYDHSPHEVFVELDELYEGDNQNKQWREMARWIKFEEDVEEGAQRWGKPHVASLSFHSLLELRKGLESGSLLLDLEASELPTIVHHLVENMVIRDQIKSEVKGQVMMTLLMKHK